MGLAGPAINGLMSQQIPDNSQGELQGAVNATNSLTAIIAPLAATQLFSFFTSSKDAAGYFPGVPFFAAGILMVLALLVFFFTTYRFGLRRVNGKKSDAPNIAMPGEITPAPRDKPPPK